MEIDHTVQLDRIAEAIDNSDPGPFIESVETAISYGMDELVKILAIQNEQLRTIGERLLSIEKTLVRLK